MSLRHNHNNSPLVKLVYSQVTERDESEKMGIVRLKLRLAKLKLKGASHSYCQI